MRENWEYISYYSFYNLQAFQVFHLHVQFMSTLYLVSFLVIYLTATGYPQTCDLQSVYYLIVSVGDASRQGWTSRCEPGCMTGGTVLLRSPVWLSEQFSFLSAASRWPPPHSLRVCVCVCAHALMLSHAVVSYSWRPHGL